MDLSAAPQASHPSALKATVEPMRGGGAPLARGGPGAPTRVIVVRSALRSHSLTDRSLLRVANHLPSGLKATAAMASVLLVQATSFAVPISRILMLLSAVPHASEPPSALKAREVMSLLPA